MANQNSHPGVNGQNGYDSASGHQPSNGISGNVHQGSLTTSHTDPTHQEHSQIETVGWAFVQQYYVTMGNNPHKLEHFYNKASSQTWGEETKVVTTTVGRSDISKRFQEIAFKDAKVRLTNVDCQGTIGSSIIIQCIGEFSNDGQGSRKFVQTFVLVPQKPEGYFVMNDVLRYLVDDIVIEENAAHYESTPPAEAMNSQPAATASHDDHAQETLPTSLEQPSAEKVIPKLDKSLSELSRNQSGGKADPQLEDRTKALDLNGHSNTEDLDSRKSSVQVAEAEAKAEDLNSDKPPERVPSPSTAPATKPQTATPQSPEPSKPSGPKTWANLVAGSRPAVPAMPTMPKLVSQKQVPRITPTPANRTESFKDNVATSPTVQADPTTATSSLNGAAKDVDTESVKDGTARRSRMSISREQIPETTSAYVKNVTSNVNHEELRQHLSTYGELTNFYVHSQKNCAFADFVSPQSFRAAVNDNPHTISGERVIVDERRFKYGNGQFGPYQGGPANRGRGGYGPPNGNKSPFPPHEGMMQGRGGYNTLPGGGENGQGQHPVGRGAFGNRGRGSMRGRGGRGSGPVGVESR